MLLLHKCFFPLNFLFSMDYKVDVRVKHMFLEMQDITADEKCLAIFKINDRHRQKKLVLASLLLETMIFKRSVAFIFTFAQTSCIFADRNKLMI